MNILENGFAQHAASEKTNALISSVVITEMICTFVVFFTQAESRVQHEMVHII